MNIKNYIITAIENGSSRLLEIERYINNPVIKLQRKRGLAINLLWF